MVEKVFSLQLFERYYLVKFNSLAVDSSLCYKQNVCKHLLAA